jgi:rhamnogalacturonyl hydrolase YesR
MGHVLMKRGALTGNTSFPDMGARLGEYFVAHVYENRSDVITDRHSALFYSESILGIPCVCWLARVTGKRAHLDLVCRLAETAIEKTQRADGLWHHFHSLHDGAKGACWSRAQLWPLVAMTESLEAMGPQAPEGEAMRAAICRTFAALAGVQDAERGVWHLVVDEPDSRIESTATAGILYCHDRLREMGVLDDRYAAMTDRALSGLKRLYYRGGLAASCRGTACGDINFYRARPQGYQLRTHLPAALAARMT